MSAKYDEIVTLTDAFCKQHLNEEYAEMSRKLTAALCRKRPSPLTSGKANSWACGIVHALGMVNFLDDSSQKPSLKASELYKQFGISESTGSVKSKQMRDAMKLSQLDSTWCWPSRLGASQSQATHRAAAGEHSDERDAGDASRNERSRQSDDAPLGVAVGDRYLIERGWERVRLGLEKERRVPLLVLIWPF